jgi:hypothetical protein
VTLYRMREVSSFTLPITAEIILRDLRLRATEPRAIRASCADIRRRVPETCQEP